ncbi:MAG: hypothetical protein N2376_00790 [Clostridia bacterium]|nr:hypothetical protein [Clostridia bacterium]
MGFRGELGAKLKRASISQSIAGTHDLTFYTEDGAFLHIVGDNDIPKLLNDAIEDYMSRNNLKAEDKVNE